MTTHIYRLYWIAAGLILAIPFSAGHGQSKTPERVRLPGSGYEVALHSRAVSRDLSPPSSALVEAIGAWLSFSFELPTASEPPNFRFVSPEAMIALRYRGVSSDHRSETTIGSGSMGASEQPDIVAVYDDALRTIYLRKDWSGHTAAGLSIVVHELVHHMQNVAGLKFGCPEEREKTAFEAQERWLGLFGSNLETALGLDPFTVLVRTNCPY
jgi:hypothetical protein